MSRVSKKQLKKVNQALKDIGIDPETGLSTRGHDARVHRRSIRFETVDPAALEEMTPLRGVGGSISLCCEGGCCNDSASDFDDNEITDIEHALERG